MGKKRIKVVGAEEAAPKEQRGRKIVKTGKEHGRITDMGAVALAEAEKIKEKEKELAKLSAESAKKSAKSAVAKKKTRKRGKRYQAAKKLVDQTKFYPLSEAIKLLKTTSISRFNGSVEIHLVSREKGLKREVKLPHPIGKQTKLGIASEKKAPLVHLVIGKLDTKDDTKDAYLTENFQAIIEAVGPKNIKKAVLTSTMGPGIKIDLASMT